MASLPSPLTDGQASYQAAMNWLDNNPTFGVNFVSFSDTMHPTSPITDPALPTSYQNDYCRLGLTRAIQPSDAASDVQKIVDNVSIPPIALPGMINPEEDWQIRGKFPRSTILPHFRGQKVTVDFFDGKQIKWCVENARLYAVRGDSITVLQVMEMLADFPQPEGSFWEIKKKFKGDICFEFDISILN